MESPNSLRRNLHNGCLYGLGFCKEPHLASHLEQPRPLAKYLEAWPSTRFPTQSDNIPKKGLDLLSGVRLCTPLGKHLPWRCPTHRRGSFQGFLTHRQAAKAQLPKKSHLLRICLLFLLHKLLDPDLVRKTHPNETICNTYGTSSARCIWARKWLDPERVWNCARIKPYGASLT